jgi:hypothetical protein
MARKSTAKREEEERPEVDELLDEILGAEEADLKLTPMGDIPEEPDETDAPEEPEQLELPLGDDPPDSEREGEEGELEADVEEGQVSDADASPPSDSEEEVALTEKEGLLKEIDILRKKLAAPAPALSQYTAPPAPPPMVSTAPPANQPVPGQVPVLVSEDGTHVYTDPEAQNAYTEATVRRMIEEARTPSAGQIKAMENGQMVQDFIALDPERNQAVAGRMKEADDYIALHMQNLVNEGHQFGSVRQAINAMRDLGLDKNVIQYFPEIEANFDEFIEGSASGNATWRRSLLEKFGGHSRSPIATNLGEPPKANIAKLPQSMSRKGGARTPNASSDEQEYNTLSDAFQEEVVLFPEGKYQRMQELGKKLGKPGYG